MNGKLENPLPGIATLISDSQTIAIRLTKSTTTPSRIRTPFQTAEQSQLQPESEFLQLRDPKHPES
jgi:hypothetical protein